MQICPACGTPNPDGAAQCDACQTPLATRPVAVTDHQTNNLQDAPARGPMAGEGAYPGSPEEQQYGAKGYNQAAEIEQQRVAPRLLPGATISHDHYRIERIIALGGMGAVYAAMDQHLQRRCAVKEMLETFTEPREREQAVEWFRREATMLHDLNHPAIPRVRDWFEESGRYYLVMDFVTGRNLAEVLDQEGPNGLPESRIRDWAIQICNVLSYLHHANIIFRDLKPANVMVAPGPNGKEQIKIIDFGIARFLRAQNESTIIVTRGFAAPEQMQGQPEPRSDIFSLGATLHRLLTRHDPATNKPNDWNFPTIRSLRPEITPGFEQIIMRALAVRPADRWTTAGEMMRAIMALPPIPAVTTSSLGTDAPSTPMPVITRTPSRALSAADDLIAQAQDSLDHGRLNEARRLAQKGIDRDPRNIQGHKILGLTYAQARPPDAQRALAEYQEALRYAANDGEAHRLIGDVYLFLLKKPNEAMTEYQQAVRLNPNDYEAHRLWGMCLEQTNQLDSARQHYAEAVKMSPSYIPAHMSYGQLALRLNRLPEAELAFVQALVLNPGLPIARHLLAQVYERQGRLAEALREADYAVQVDPRDQDAQATLQRLRRLLKTSRQR